MRKLTAGGDAAYPNHFSIRSREPVYRFPNELPIAGAPSMSGPWAEAYHAWLLDTEIPKLFFWAEPGAIISTKRADWLRHG